METVKLAEAIKTWQGEGPDAGKGMMLLRFSLCNRTGHQQCWFCDTSMRLRNVLESTYTFESIQDIMRAYNLGLMITGGEPTLGRYIEKTRDLLNQLAYPFANVETNGHKLLELIPTVEPNKRDRIKYIYSPKFFSSYELDNEIKNTVLLMQYPNVYIKLVFPVVMNVSDSLPSKYLDAILTIRDLKVKNRIYLMPEGKTREELINNSPVVFDACEKFNVNFTSRSHIIYNFI